MHELLPLFPLLILVGVLVGVTTVLFGFGGGFVTVPIIAVVHAGLGGQALGVATATSALVMLVNAAVATAATPRSAFAHVSRWRDPLLLLALGGALGAAAGRFAPDALLRWGFVAYVAVTIADLVLRPGFVRAAPARPARTAPQRLPAWLCTPIGAVAAFLGVGGSVMTVPLMRRAGAPMSVATTLANPLTLAIVAPALLVALAISPPGGAPGAIGSVDAVSALALLIGAIPVIVLLRRRPPRIPEAAHAWTYIALLAASALTVALTS